MNSKHTLVWFVIAVALSAFIFAYHFFQGSNNPQSPQILPGLHPQAVTSIQIIPNNAPEISADCTNGSWLLTQPVTYPAQSAAIQGLLDALQKLNFAVVISPAELDQIHDANAQYGFGSPSVTLAIQSGNDRQEILVGNKTAPGDQVFLRVIGREGIYVTDSSWLKLIPPTADSWRDSSLLSGSASYDSIVLTNGVKIIELHANPTNHLWQMFRPLVARANSDYIANALQQLQTARVSQFVTDSSNFDPTAFGLQPANLDLWLGNGSNYVTALHVGKNSTNDSSQVYARLERWNTVVTTAQQPLSPWAGTVNDFRDPYLLELTAPVAQIELVGPGTNHIILNRQDANTWQIPGENFPVDPDSVQGLIQLLAGMKVSDFVKNVVTAPDLPAYGLATPSRQVILRSAIDDTNAVIAQLLFGGSNTNEVFVRRVDEDFIYGITYEDFGRLPVGPAWQFRERRIWNFNEGDVAKITVHQNGKTLQMIHNGQNQWSLAAGSQGVIVPAAIEEVAHDLGNMAAVAWWARNLTNPADYGLTPNSLSITVTLKNGQSATVDFGSALSGQTSLAAVTLNGERWAFIFPPEVYQLVMSYLAIPAGVP